jgi:hypothetical protein
MGRTCCECLYPRSCRPPEKFALDAMVGGDSKASLSGRCFSLSFPAPAPLTVASPDPGKLMLAEGLPGILAPLESLEASGIR